MWCLRSLFTEYWYSSLWAENTQSTRPCPQERTPGVVPNLLPFVIRKSVLGMSKLFSQKRYRSNQFDFPVFLLTEGVNYRVDIYPEIKMDMNKDQWTKPGICHGSSEKCFDSFHGVERSFSSGSGHCRRQKNSQNERDVWIQLSIQSIQYIRQCAWGVLFSRPTGFPTLAFHIKCINHHWCLPHMHARLSIDQPQSFCADSLELIAVL